MKIIFTLFIFSLFVVGSINAQFIENKGQVMDLKYNPKPNVHYYYETSQTYLYFEKDRVVYSLVSPELIDESAYQNNAKGLDSIKKLRLATYHRFDMVFENANENVEIIAGKKQKGNINFYLNERNGIRDVGTYNTITYKNIYNNIDLIFYQNEKGLKYDFVLHKGAKINDIRIAYQGVENLTLENGQIIFSCGEKTFEEKIPLSFKNGDKSDIVEVKYVINENQVFFSTKEENYNELTIDPVLEWATYFNGTSAATDVLDYYNNHLDANGNSYIYGQTWSGANNYPVVNPGGAYTASYNASSDAYLAKFDTNRTLVWSTYIGGSDAEYLYGSRNIDSHNGVLHIVGEAMSTGAPYTNGGGYYNTTVNRNFWARFNSSTGQLLHLTSLLGGYKPSIAVSSAGVVAIIKDAYDFNNPVILSRTGAFNQATNGGFKDMHLMMFDASYNTIWGTFLGGPGTQENFMCRFDASGNLFFVGESSWAGASTAVNERLVTLAGAYNQSTHGGGTDVLLGRFSSAGVLNWNTLYGGNNSDARQGQQGGYAKIDFHPTSGEMILAFNTTSSNLSTSNPGGGAYYKTVPTHPSFAGSSGSFWNYAAYFARFTSACAVNYATYYYNSTDGDLIFDITFGGCNKFYIAGRCDHITATTIPLSGGFNMASGQQTYIMQFNTANFVAEWSSFIATNVGYNPAAAGRSDNPRVYFAARGYYSNGPTVNPGGGAYYNASNINGASNSNFMLWQFHPTLPPDVTGITTICSGQTTTLTASNGAGAPYEWYTTSSGGAPFFTGAVYTTPALSSNTTYYVSSGTGICASPRVPITVTVNPAPAPPVLGSNSPVCVGGTLNLTANTIPGATYTWNGPNLFSSSDEDPVISSVTSINGGSYTCYITVSGCNSVTPSIFISINTPSVAPTGITGTTTICSGNSTTLTLSGGTPGTGATAQWFTGSCGGTAVGTGNSITVSPSSNTTYFVRYEGTCNTTTCASVSVTVNSPSVAPTGITGTTTICSGNSTTLTLSGGTAGSGATANWYTGPNGTGTFVGTGSSVSVSPTSTTTYYVRYEGTCNNTSDASLTVTVNTLSIAPTSITGTTTICSGNSTTLTLSGGTAGSGATAQWFSGSCGGTAVGTGNSITVSPTVTTAYFVRYSGTCNTSTCASVTVTVENPSVAPTSITGTSTICSGSSTTLTLSGGTAGTDATANWYTGPNGTGMFVGTGSSVTVSPTSTITYYVRYEGTCNTTADAFLTVTVNTLSVAPTSITGTTTICSGNSTTLTLSGGTAGTGATAQWFSGSCGGTAVGTGNSISVSPTATTTYFVRYAGTCNTTTCASVTVTVNNAPATPGTISGTTPICNGTSNTYSILSVPTAVSYTWVYTGGGTPTGTGISTTFTPTSSGTLTVTATNSCGTSSAQTLAITVNTAENAAFTLSSNTQCQNGTNITATITGISGGTFSSTPAGLSLNASTGAINVAASTPNTYTVTYTTPGSCPGTSNTSVTINATQSSAFTLSAGTVCQNGSNVTANITGIPGGAFSSTSGLSLNAATGAINVLASTPNTYNVTYTSPGPCASSTVQPITINAPDNAAFSYSGGTFCTSGTNPTPTITGLAGGTFTATPAGLSINATTGAINLAASSVNSYVVTYTTNGSCPNTSTANINITNAPSAVFSYTGTPYCSNAGTATVTFGIGAGGGAFSATPTGLSINTTTGAVNLSASTPNTYTVTNFIAAASGCAAATETTTITINAAESANFSLSSAAQCQNGTDISATITGTSGGTFTAAPAGLSINASTGAIDVSASTGGTYTVTYTTPGTCSDAQNTTVTITTADNASFTLSSASVCQNGSDVTASISGTVGGTFSSTPAGLSLNTTNGAIDVSASTAGTYDVTYTTTGTCPSSSTVLITISATDNASFNYTGTTFCASGTNPIPTITGLAGGTFSATPAGLTLNASTGEITLATSAINNYVVTYTTNGSCPTTATANVNVTNSPSATFTYSSTSICGGTGTTSVSFPIGASGGVFSATPTGLSINASTGEIDLSASSPNTYTVTNFIAASGGCASATDNFVITILPADDASFTFPSVSACQSLATYTPTIIGTSGGSFTSSPAGLIINGTTGVIDLENSSVGNYTITYTTTGTCPNTENVSLEVLSSPIAPTVSVDNSVVCAGDPVIISATGSGGGVSYSVFSTLTGGTTLGATPLTVNPTTTTNYYVEAFGSNGCGNIGGRQQITVTVNPLPTVSAGSDQTICPTESATLTATGSGSFVWSTTETSASITVTPAITTTYTVTLTDGNSCSNSANVVVTVQSTGGSLIANDDTYTATSGNVSTFNVLNNDINGSTPNLISGPINGNAMVNSSNQIVYTSNPNYVGTDIITYTICDAFCTNICDTAVVTITVSREIVIEVPGGFTPNGDNINDIFVIQGLDQYPNNELTIYNRWGSIVYSAKPYNNDWDGKSTGSGVIMGDYVTTGTYFYVLKLSEDQEPLKGSLEIKFN